MSFAKAFVTGTVTKLPEKRFTQNDLPIAGFTINVDKNNDTLLRVVSFGQLAETVSATIKEGDSVAVEGRLQVNSFDMPNGRTKKVFEINASTVEKLGAGAIAPQSASSGVSTPSTMASNNEQIVQFSQDEVAQDLIDDDEIPF